MQPQPAHGLSIHISDSSLLPSSSSFSSSSAPSSPQSSSSSSAFPFTSPLLSRIACSCSTRLCLLPSSQPPLQRWTYVVSVLVSSRCLSQICICETLYLVLLLAPVLYALSQQSALPERAAAIVYMCTLLLRSVVLLALHARVPAPAEYYSRHQAVRLFLRVLTMGSCVSVVCLLDSSSVLRGDSLPALALWCVAAVEVYLALSQLGLYALLHLFFPHAALSCLAPFMPLNAAFAAVDSPKPVSSAPSLSTLRAIPALSFNSASMRCDTCCAVCMSDMQEGDRVRLFTCCHAFHADCIDNWLVRRPVCPLCVAIVNIRPADAAATEVEMGTR